MGTRHLIAATIGDTPKIAQYGQWDGYPSGQGIDVLGFARRIVEEPGGVDKFRAKLEATTFLSEKELETLYNSILPEAAGNDWVTSEQADKFNAATGGIYSRDTGAGILDIVHESPEPLKLQDSYTFALDSLWCEYAYVIDVERRTFEAYTGPPENVDPPAGERFSGHRRVRSPGPNGKTKPSKYGAVGLVGSWSLDALPTDAEFYAAFGLDAEGNRASE